MLAQHAVVPSVLMCPVWLQEYGGGCRLQGVPAKTRKSGLQGLAAFSPGDLWPPVAFKISNIITSWIQVNREQSHVFLCTFVRCSSRRTQPGSVERRIFYYSSNEMLHTIPELKQNLYYLPKHSIALVHS